MSYEESSSMQKSSRKRRRKELRKKEEEAAHSRHCLSFEYGDYFLLTFFSSPSIYENVGKIFSSELLCRGNEVNFSKTNEGARVVLNN